MSAFGTSGHDDLNAECPLLGVKQTSRRHVPMSAYDPKRTSGRFELW
jgi:hypothetical protein